jgi:hypothetical protein
MGKGWVQTAGIDATSKPFTTDRGYNDVVELSKVTDSKTKDCRHVNPSSSALVCMTGTRWMAVI